MSPSSTLYRGSPTLQGPPVSFSASSAGKKVMMEGLFVACQDGTLVQYVLEPRPKAVASADKVSEDMPLDLGIVGQLQWSLSRSVASCVASLPEA